MKYVVRVLLFVLILLSGVIAIGYYWTFVRLAPQYAGTWDLPELAQKVDIKRDTWGVPEIKASSEDDLFYALGFVHAQERLWQMTLSQLTVDGRFSQFFGPELIPVDQFLHTIDFNRISKQNYALLSDEEKRLLSAYANGVNAWTAQSKTSLPIEFSLAGMNPIPWEPHHSIGIARLMAWQLNVTWSAEMAYAILEQKLSAEQFRLIKPENWPDRYKADSNRSDSTALSFQKWIEIEQQFRAALSMQGSHVGSNAWAVSGSKTKSGKPILAGDPHLGLAVPGVWFEVSLQSPTIKVAGVSIPGVPGVVLGQKDAFAWSFTNVMADDTDFFLEQEHPTDSTRYLADVTGTDSTWATFDFTVHYIAVKNENPRPLLVRRTQNGPIINSIYTDVKVAKKPLIVMNWTGLIPSQEFSAILGMNRAEDRIAFKEAIKKFKAPSQNCLFADSSGFIAQWTIGRIPSAQENLPLWRYGWLAPHRWNSFYEFDQLPQTENPPSGFVASANNPIGNATTYLSRYWEPPSRYLRLVELLSSEEKMDAEVVRSFATDVKSPHAEEIIARLLPVFASQPERPSVKRTYSYLYNWDFRYDTKSTAAGIFDVFFVELTRLTLEDDFGRDVFNLFAKLENIPVRSMHEILRQDSLFYDRTNTPELETRDSLLFLALDRAVSYLDKNLGEEPHQWRWENLHQLTLSPALFGQAAEKPDANGALKLIVSEFLNIGPSPSPGNGMTLNNGQYDWEKPFRQVLGPSVRRVVDFNEPTFSWSVLPAGQSGNPISKHYDDQNELWLTGKSRKFFPLLPDSLVKNRMTLESE